MKDLSELRFFLGIEFARLKAGLVMHQRKYAHLSLKLNYQELSQLVHQLMCISS